MVTNKLYLDDRNNEYIVLCKFGSHSISGCKVTGVFLTSEKYRMTNHKPHTIFFTSEKNRMANQIVSRF